MERFNALPSSAEDSAAAETPFLLNLKWPSIRSSSKLHVVCYSTKLLAHRL